MKTTGPNHFDQNDALGFQQNTHNTGTDPITLQAERGAESVYLPMGEEMLDAEFSRQGKDLLINEGEITVRDYFLSDATPELLSNHGKRIEGTAVDILAGSRAASQYAGPTQGLKKIGVVEKLEGSVTVKRADGTKEELESGDQVFENDVIETGHNGSVGIRFEDDSVFALGEDARMTLDKLVYDPETGDGESSVNVIKGMFKFVSGEIAANNPGDMQIKTPVATIGIRGTTGGGTINGEGQENDFFLAKNADGTHGKFDVVTKNGVITIDKPFMYVPVRSINDNFDGIDLRQMDTRQMADYDRISNVTPEGKYDRRVRDREERDDNRNEDNDQPQEAGNADNAEAAAEEGAEGENAGEGEATPEEEMSEGEEGEEVTEEELPEEGDGADDEMEMQEQAPEENLPENEEGMLEQDMMPEGEAPEGEPVPEGEEAMLGEEIPEEMVGPDGELLEEQPLPGEEPAEGEEEFTFEENPDAEGEMQDPDGENTEDGAMELAEGENTAEDPNFAGMLSEQELQDQSAMGVPAGEEQEMQAFSGNENFDGNIGEDTTVQDGEPAPNDSETFQDSEYNYREAFLPKKYVGGEDFVTQYEPTGEYDPNENNFNTFDDTSNETAGVEDDSTELNVTGDGEATDTVVSGDSETLNTTEAATEDTNETTNTTTTTITTTTSTTEETDTQTTTTDTTTNDDTLTGTTDDGTLQDTTDGSTDGTTDTTSDGDSGTTTNTTTTRTKVTTDQSYDLTLTGEYDLSLTGSAHIDGIGNTHHNKLYGNDGDNILIGGWGDDTVYGGLGSDFIIVDHGNDSVSGGAGADEIEIFGSAGAVKALGDAGNDRFYVDSGHDHTLRGGAGDDEYEVFYASGTLKIDVRAGSDVINVGNLDSNIVVDWANGDASVKYIAFHHMHASDMVFEATGTSGQHLTISSSDPFVGGGTVTLLNYFSYAAGSRPLQLDFNSTDLDLNLAAFDTIADFDSVTAKEFVATGVANTYTGGDYGGNSIDYNVLTPELITGIDADLAAGTVDYNINGTQQDTLVNIQELIATGLDDTITGGTGDNFLDGAGGADSIYGGMGWDTLLGGGGADTLVGGTTSGDIDFVSYMTAIDSVTAGEGVYVSLQENTAQSLGTTNDHSGDMITNVEGIVGSDFNDTLVGSGTGATNNPNTDNALFGGWGDDVLKGLEGSDTLSGGAGTDTIYLNDGAADDAARDHVIYEFDDLGSGPDTITDFQIGTLSGAGTTADAINLSSLIEGYGHDVTFYELLYDGILELNQQGSDTLLRFNNPYDGTSNDLAILTNVDSTQLEAHHFILQDAEERFGTISGDPSLSATSDYAVIYSGDGNDYMFASPGNTHFQYAGTGADQVGGGADFNIYVLDQSDGNWNDTVTGVNTSEDVLQIVNHGATVDLSSISMNYVDEIQVLNGVSGDVIQGGSGGLTADEISQITGTAGDPHHLFLDGDSGDSVMLSAEWTLSGNLFESDDCYSIYKATDANSDEVTLYVNDQITTNQA